MEETNQPISSESVNTSQNFWKEKGKWFSFLSILVLAIVALSTPLFINYKQTINSHAANTLGSTTPSSKTFTILLSPKMISDFNNPQASIDSFYQTYSSLMKQYANKIIIFAVGTGDHIFQYPSQAPSPQTRTPLASPSQITWDMSNSQWNEVSGLANQSGNSVQIQVQPAATTSARAVILNYNSTDLSAYPSLRSFPTVNWNWQSSGTEVGLAFYIQDRKTLHPPFWISYFAGNPASSGSTFEKMQLSQTTSSTWSTQQVNLYQDAGRIFGLGYQFIPGGWHQFEQTDWIVTGFAFTTVGGQSQFQNIQFSSDGGVNWARNTNYPGSNPDQTPYTDQTGRLYPQNLSYGQIKNIVSAFKQEASKFDGLGNVQILDMIDPGPEFGVQDWKYAMHHEVIHPSYGLEEIDIDTILNTDNYNYASYPNGIPSNTTAGTFIANQTIKYVNDLGFDGIYMANAFGTIGQWYPNQISTGFDANRATMFFNFMKQLKTGLGSKVVMWMDSYYPVNIEHDKYSIPNWNDTSIGNAYQYMDYLEISTFWQDSSGTPIIAWQGGTMKDSIDSHLGLHTFIPNTKVLWTFYYLDPWYYGGGYTDKTSYLWWNTADINYDYNSKVDGAVLYATGEKGQTPDVLWLSSIIPSQPFPIVGVPVSGKWQPYQKVDMPGIINGSTILLAETSTLAYGLPTDTIIMCDWNGTGIKTPGSFRNGTWYLKYSNIQGTGQADLTFNYGLPGDIPICGDWTGQRKQTVGVFRPSNATWYLRNSNSSGVADISFNYGAPGDIPIVGKWQQGASKDTIGVIRNATFYLRNSNTKGVADITFNYGVIGDKYTVGDWNGNGIDSPAVLRGNTWYIRYTNNSGVADKTFYFP